MSGIIEASIKERLLFKHFEQLRKDFTITHFSKEDSMDTWDVVYKSGVTECVADIKVRNFHLVKYDTKGWLIELQKYKSLLHLQQIAKRPIKPMYINIFKDAVVIWDLSEIQPPTFKKQLLPLVNETNKTKTYVPKDVAYIKSIQGTIYQL